jgi:hypothetical protein
MHTSVPSTLQRQRDQLSGGDLGYLAKERERERRNEGKKERRKERK